MADARTLKLQFDFKWKLILDNNRESEPEAHFYISTIYSSKVHVSDLGRSAGNKEISLQFVVDRPSREITHTELAQNCCLNVDFYVHTTNKFNECVSNPAGSVLIPLFELMSTNNGVVEAPVYLYMVHNQDRNNKGRVAISPISPLPGFTRPPVMMSYGGKAFDVAQVASPLQIKECLMTLKRNNYICLRAIDASDEIYGSENGFKPTMPSVKKINSSIWISRAGSTAPLFFTLDLVDPAIEASYFLNAIEIIRRRMRLKESDLLRMNLNKPTAADLKTFGSFVGQLLCLYVIHCSYRDDFVNAYDSKLKAFIIVMTENFGDVSVDKGAGDCEDFGKIIIRLFLALRRIRLHSVELENHPLLKKVAEFLACFVPFLVLYGVSSAQINEAPSDIKKMGAHENAVLTPLHQVITEIARFDEGIYKWVKEVKEVEPNIEEYIEKSKHYQSLILEGTGVLEAVPDTEAHQRLRIFIEEVMDDDSFSALRRKFYYSTGASSFYKTVDKMFSPLFMLTGARFGAFIVLQETPEAKNKPKRSIPLKERYTKSANFALFVKNDSSVAMIMEPPFEAEELRAAQRVMKDVHPPAPIKAPSRHFEKRDDCDKLLLQTFGPSLDPPTEYHPYVWEYRSEPLPSAESVDPLSAYVEQTYYLRSGKVYEESLLSIHKLFSKLGRRGFLKKVICYPEWPDYVVGGYRLVLEISQSK